jgi:hypothetical protein
MELIYKNSYIKTKDFYNEYYKCVHLTNRRNIVLIVIGAICIAVNLSALIFSGGDSALLINLTIVVLLVCGAKFIAYKAESDTRHKQDLEFGGGKPLEISLTVTQNGLDYYVANYQTKTHFNFADLRRARKLGGFFVVTTKSAYPLIFRKDSFVTGSPDEFLTFLRSRGVRG